MDVPAGFARRLHEQSRGALRLRWSAKDHEFHLEEKVGRAALPPIRVDEGRDDLIRAKDGYALVMVIRPGDRMPCRRCGKTLKVPVMRTAEVSCPTCSFQQQRQVAYKASYWPLGESLLEYLRKIDPRNGGTERQVEEVEHSNAKLQAAQEKALKDHGEDVLRDGFTEIMQIPSVGYTGRERYQESVGVTACTPLAP